MPSASSSELKPGDVKHGFEVTRVTPLKNLRASAIELEHQKTGARVLHVRNDDAENLFSVAFRTPPKDDTGLPHILEHVVLAGSKRFPVKDPFVEMVKMSMATFINAMTYSDKTVYPVASNVKKDFYNLATVYCDAVFHPRLLENSFKQEGHHLAFEKKNGQPGNLIVKGIVFNEMKGAYSDADEFVDRLTSRALFPDTPYGKDSGGDPEKIPDLTYKDFKRFYQELYHPSNAYVFFYGDLPTEENLKFLNKQLAGFSRRKTSTDIPFQKLWKAPKARKERYPIGRDEKTKNKTFLMLCWRVGAGTNPLEVLAFMVLDLALLGNAAAPLRKALIDSKLGEDLADSGFTSGRLEGTFQVGLKGSEAGRKAKFEKLVFDTLKRLAKEGLPKEKIEAAFHQISYRYFEIQSMYPLWQMERVYAAWIYGADPLSFLRADELLEELKACYASDPRYFEKLLEERLLDNNHRVSIVAEPDRKLNARKEAAFLTRMKRLRARLSKPQLERIAREAAALEKLQGKPNPPEAIASLPQLKVSELPRKPRHIPCTLERLASGVELIRNDVFTNGVNYLHLDIDMAGLPVDLYPYLSLYSDAVHKMGAAGLDYVKMAERTAANTGGVRYWTYCNAAIDGPERSLRHSRFALKALDEKLDQALDVLKDVLFELDLRDTARLKDVMIQAKAAHRSSLVAGGLDMAARHAARGLNTECYLADVLGGLPQTRLVEQLADNYDREHPGLQEYLTRIRDFMLARGRFSVGFTGTDEGYRKVRAALEDWTGRMRGEPIADVPVPFTPIRNTFRAGLAAPMEVAYCCQIIPAYHVEHPDAPLLLIGSRLLSLEYMWEEVRVKGGAYGGGVSYNGVDRTWQFYSYRDPWITRTYNTFRGLLDHVKKTQWSQMDLNRAIIGAAKYGEKPIRPAEATTVSLWRHVCGDTPERRERRHTALLSVTVKEVKRAVIELLESNFEQGGRCVVSSREKLEQANKENPNEPFSVEDIMKS